MGLPIHLWVCMIAVALLAFAGVPVVLAQKMRRVAREEIRTGQVKPEEVARLFPRAWRLTGFTWIGFGTLKLIITVWLVVLGGAQWIEKSAETPLTDSAGSSAASQTQPEAAAPKPAPPRIPDAWQAPPLPKKSQPGGGGGAALSAIDAALGLGFIAAGAITLWRSLIALVAGIYLSLVTIFTTVGVALMYDAALPATLLSGLIPAIAFGLAMWTVKIFCLERAVREMP